MLDNLEDLQDLNSLAAVEPEGDSFWFVKAVLGLPRRVRVLLTGRYQQRYGFEFNTAGAAITHRLWRGLDPEAITLADVLRKAGYVTGMFGKWHLGTRKHLHPQSRGFDEFYGFLGGATCQPRQIAQPQRPLP